MVGGGREDAAQAARRQERRLQAQAGMLARLVPGRRVVETPIGQAPGGLALDESVGAGSRVRLRFQPPDRKPLDVESIVWRNDSDGPVFVFVNMPDEDFERLKSLVDEHRGS